MRWIVVGGGLFGCYAATVLADRGNEVILIEQGSGFLGRASFVNQARLHTGLHYPRSIVTASETLASYRQFRSRFPTAIRDFTQIYAVAKHNSKTTPSAFAAFAARLGVPTEEVDPHRWFHRGTIARAFRVEEPSFDATTLRALLTDEIRNRSEITVACGVKVIGGTAGPDRVQITLDSGEVLEASGVVLATYAGTNGMRTALDLEPFPLTFELAEVLTGRVSPDLADLGFTVMDGPFWSLMPFGHSPDVSLTSVGLTPLRRAKGEPRFSCQDERDGCNAMHLADCTSCPVRPPSAVTHQLQQLSLFLKNASSFSPTGSLLTVKAVLASTEVDDARPTLVHKEIDKNVYTVFSGKVSTLFALDRELP